MGTFEVVAKNALTISVAQICSYILAFFSIAYTARYLGAEGYGIISFALAFTGIFKILTDVGLNALIVRDLVRDQSKAGKYISNILAIKIFLSVVSFALIVLTINLLRYPADVIQVVYINSVSMILSSFVGMYYSKFQAFESFKYQSVAMITGNGLTMVGVFLIINYKLGVNEFSCLYLLVNMVLLFCFIIIDIRKYHIIKLDVDIYFWKAILRESLPYGVSTVFITVYGLIGTILLSYFNGNQEVGWYNAAFQLVTVTLFIPSNLNIVLFPVMSKFFISSKESFRYAFEKYFKYMLILSLPLGVGTTLLADKVIRLVYGDGYANSVIVLQILIWYAVFSYISSAFGRLIESSNKQIIETKICGFCMVVNLIANLLLIPLFAAIGVAVSTVITELLILLLFAISCSKLGYSIPKKSVYDVFGVFFATTVIGIFICFSDTLSLFVVIPISILIYIMILLILKVLGSEEAFIVKSIITIKR